MKIKKYIINENKKHQEMILFIKENCSKFLKEAGFNFAYRGSQKRIENYDIFPGHLIDRRPMNTAQGIHDLLNRKFTEKFGWAARNGVFCLGESMAVAFYGKPFLFFPVGDYKYVWSPTISDLFGVFHAPAEMRGMTTEKWYKQYPDEVNDLVEKVIEKYIDKDLAKALTHTLDTKYKNHVEISFMCDKYILVNEDKKYNLMDVFKK